MTVISKILLRIIRGFYNNIYFKKKSSYLLKLKIFLRGSFHYYPSFIDHLSNGNATGAKSFPWRELDLFDVLDKYKPLSIVEFGGGSSTGIFSTYTRISNGSFISVDESEEWSKLTFNSLVASDDKFSSSSVSFINTNRLENSFGSFYDFKLTNSVDLLYIDGPSVKKLNNSKLPNQDIHHLFSSGVFPKLILIDGRVATVQSILDSPYSNLYKFIPSTAYFQNKLSIRFLFTPRVYFLSSLFVRNDIR